LEGEWLVKGYGSFEIQKLASLLSGYE
jgi:hypothetical protein